MYFDALLMNDMLRIIFILVIVILHSICGVLSSAASNNEYGEETELFFSAVDEPNFGGLKEIKSSPVQQNQAAATVSDYRKVINELLSESDAQDFYSLEGDCLDHAAVLLEKLREKGFDKIMLAQTSDNGEAVNMSLNDGSKERAYKTHYFLVDRTMGAGSEIIIDPTIYQFIAAKPSQATANPIFVGEKSDLETFYTDNRNQSRHDISDPHSAKTGKYNPNELVCLIYSVDQCSKNRTNFER